MKYLLILNDPPYGSERTYNALRLAGALGKDSQNEIRVFLVGDAASGGRSDQKPPEGFYNIQLMLDRILKAGGRVGLCGSCMDARGMRDAELIPGAQRSSLEELRGWTEWADKVLVF